MDGPQGESYFNLAHQYIAAQLNMLDGADGSAISIAFSKATALFNQYTDEQVAAFQGARAARKFAPSSSGLPVSSVRTTRG